MSRALCLLLVIAGPLGVVMSLAFGLWMIAPLWVLCTLAGARLIGWAEIDEEAVSHRRLIGDSTSVPFDHIREVGLGMHQVKKTKWWYPEIETTDGNSVKFLMLKSPSGKRTIACVQEIFEACMARIPQEGEDQFTSVTVSEDGELEFLLSPGYDEFRRDRAANGDQEVVVAPAPEPTPEPQQRTTATRAPHLTLCEPVEKSEIDEDAPEVFTPRPLNDRRKSETQLTVVHDEFVERAEDKRTDLPDTASPKKLPAVVIEPPTQVETPPSVEPAPARQFTSLFRRAS